jgi:CO/xanthine dehydrogenase Mo-binding subunit
LRALELSEYHEKRAEFERTNSESAVKRGMGFATFMHGAGFTGSGEVMLKSVVTVEATREGRVRILTASTEIGQGTNTIFSQIAAEALELPYEQVELAQPDTAHVPNSGPTVASRTVMVVGKLVEAACVQLREVVGATNGDFASAAARYFEQHGREARASSEYHPPPGAGWNDETYQGDAYGAYAWAVYVAAVSVDTRTYETRVDDFVALQEVGKVIHPVLARGQIEGGVAQAIGFALYENCVWKSGRMANAQMTNYIMPTSADLPPIRVFFEENPYAYGPAGAKGIGELPMDGVAPAILNAVEHATGVSVTRIPMTPEVLMEALGH